jgi:hypothetical protein
MEPTPVTTSTYNGDKAPADLLQTDQGSLRSHPQEQQMYQLLNAQTLGV